jgi:hypothetical protein
MSKKMHSPYFGIKVSDSDIPQSGNEIKNNSPGN